VAPGPGYLALELARTGRCRVTGLDISETFVDIARRGAMERGVQVDFRQGDVAHMPFADGLFDWVVCTAAFKNFSQPVAALEEIRRVMKPEGVALIVDLRRDASREAIHAFVDGMGLSAINAAITKWTFRFMLIKRAYTIEEFRGFAARSGLGTCDIRPTATGFEARLRK
jgi:ubiquinone/menaquinone biosynthesis C-methylase UbiE